MRSPFPRREPPVRFAAATDDAPPLDLFALDDNERASALWRKLRTELTKRLEAKRKENDGPLDAEATARARGYIEFAREVIALGDDPPTFDE